MAAEIKALYNKHADTDFDAENREPVAAMKDLFESMTGVSLSDEALETEEDLFARTEERLRAKAQEQAQEQASARAPARRPSAAERRQQAQAEQATQLVREVYRKLASALHPDRADGEADRLARTALVQRVNQAFCRRRSRRARRPFAWTSRSTPSCA